MNRAFLAEQRKLWTFGGRVQLIEVVTDREHDLISILTLINRRLPSRGARQREYKNTGKFYAKRLGSNSPPEIADPRVPFRRVETI